MMSFPRILVRLQLIFLCCAFTLKVNAQNPNWSVNATQYSNTMNVIGFIKVFGVESKDVNDQVGAFIDNELRGVSSPIYVPEIDRYVVFLSVYSNGSSGQISFKIYDASADEILTVTSTAEFVPDGLVGGLDESFLWSNVTLNTEALIENFEIQSQVGSTNINALNIQINASLGTNETVSSQLATFSVSDGATIRFDNELQLSGQTAYDFTNPLVFQVQSEDLLTVNQYTVTVTIINSAPSSITLSNSSVDENQSANTFIGSLTSSDADAGDTHRYELVPGLGADDNALFSLTNSSLLTAAKLNYEESSTREIRIKSTDSYGKSIEQSIVIQVFDVNEAPSNIGLSSQQLDENLAEGSLVATLTATDDDVNDTFTYELVSGAGDLDNNLFEIENNKLKAKVSFNYEESPVRRVRLKVTDSAGLSFVEGYNFTINNVNEAPILNKSIEDEVIPINEERTLEFPADLMTDEDEGDVITYSATMSDDTNLPSWIVLNVSERKFEFNARVDNAGDHLIKITGTDVAGLSTETTFKLTVDIVSGIESEFAGDQRVQVYPNPAKDRFTIDLAAYNGRAVEIKIFNNTGIEIYNKAEIKSESHSIDVGNYLLGVYIVLIKSEFGVVTKKLMIAGF